MAHTGGAGVDVVLNALSGEMIAGGFRVLRLGGRFLEVGKAGMWSDEEARQARPDVAYHRVALDRSIDRAPAAVGASWCDLIVELADRRLTPFTVTAFRFGEAEAAYRFMQLGSVPT